MKRQYIVKTAWMQWDEQENRNIGVTAQKIIWADSKYEARMNLAELLIEELEKPENPWKLDLFNKAFAKPLFN